MKPATLLFLVLPSCTVPRAPERALDPVPAPNITITVRGGDQMLRSDMPMLEEYLRRDRAPQVEETYYQRRPIYPPEPVPYPAPSPVPSTVPLRKYTRPERETYTWPDPIDQIPLEPHHSKYPPYAK